MYGDERGIGCRVTLHFEIYIAIGRKRETFVKSTDDLVKIVSFGGGVVIDSTKSTDDLVKIASFAAGKGSRVVIKNAGRKSTDDLVKIASFGKGAVLFDFTE